MVIELTLSNVITVLALFVMALWALVKVISGQQDRRLTERFKALDTTMQAIAQAQTENGKSIRELERPLAASKPGSTTLHCAWSALWVI